MFENNFNSKKTDPLVEAVKGAMQDGDLRRQAVALVNEAYGVFNRNAVIREELAEYDATIEDVYYFMKEDIDFEFILEGEDDDYAKKYAGDAKPTGVDREVGSSRKKRLTARAKIRQKMGPGKIKVSPEGISHTKRGKKMGDYDTTNYFDRKGNKVGRNTSTFEIEREEYDARIEEAYKCMKEGKPLDPVGKEDPQGDVNNNGIPASKDKSDQYLLKRRAAIGKAMGKRMEEESDGLPPSAAAKQAAKQTSTPASTPTPTRTKDLSSTFSSARGATGMNEAKIKVKGNDPLEARAEYAKKGGTGQVYKKTHPKDKVGMSQADAYAIRGTGPKRGSHLPEETLDEATYSAKDIGKKGKEFEKIAKSAAKRYGSEERGKKVAGAILKRIRAKHMEEATQIDELSAFGREFAAARARGEKQFMSKVTGKMTTTALKQPSTASKGPQDNPGLKGATGFQRTIKGPQDNPGLKGATGFQRTMKTDVDNIKVSPSTPGSGYSQSAERMKAMKPETTPTTPGSMKISSQPAPTSGPSGQEKMDAMKNLKPDAPTPTTPGSMKISSQPAPSSGPSGAEKMDTMSNLKPTAPTASPAPSMSMSDPKARALKESVQVGDNKYRIV